MQCLFLFSCFCIKSVKHSKKLTVVEGLKLEKNEGKVQCIIYLCEPMYGCMSSTGKQNFVCISCKYVE